MRRLRTPFAMLLAGLMAGVFLFGPPCSAGSVEGKAAPWEIVYHDGSGNAFRFWRDSNADEARFEYTPVTPQESSSGTYSGGKAKSGPLDEVKAKKLWHLVRKLELDSPFHAGSRGMGTGAFLLKDAGGNREFLVKEGPSLRGFDRFLAELRASRP